MKTTICQKLWLAIAYWASRQLILHLIDLSIYQDIPYLIGLRARGEQTYVARQSDILLIIPVSLEICSPWKKPNIQRITSCRTGSFAFCIFCSPVLFIDDDSARHPNNSSKKKRAKRRRGGEKTREEGRMAYSQIGDRVEGPSRCLIGADSLF